MKVKIDKFKRRLMSIVPAIALALALQSVSATCFFWFHQPDVPEELM